MPRKKRVQKNKFYDYGVEKYGRPAFWHKSNWKAHLYHEALLTYDSVFRETLSDPDKIFPSLNDPGRSCYYKMNAFQKGTAKKKVHAQVVIIEEPERDIVPIKGKFVIVTTAMDRDNIPEEGRLKPKFDKKKQG